MAVNVFLNYYVASDPLRAQEIDACYMQWMKNQYIDKMFVIKEPNVVTPYKPFLEIELDSRPAFAIFFDNVAKVSEDNDINIISNSDCFLSEKDMPKLNALGENVAYCLSRLEIKKATPLRLHWFANRRNRRKHDKDMQDCWIFRGKPRSGMMLDFRMGVAGCDNRLAWELHNAGYSIVNPAAKIRLYHYHCSQFRNSTEADRVPQPYAFPERVDHV